VQHERDAFGGFRVSRAASSASPRESPRMASCSGSVPVSELTSGSATWGSSGASRRVFRERSMLRLTRPTTVVSHARRFSTSSASVRRNEEVRATELDPAERVVFFRDVLGPFARSIPFGYWFVRLVDGVDLRDPVKVAEGRRVFELHPTA
jgi:hypothetical protein